MTKNRFVVGSGVPFLSVAYLLLSASLLFAAPGDPPFIQDSLADGVISIEAENFHSNAMAGAHAWTEEFGNFYSGGKAMTASPNSGASLNSVVDPNSPRLDYIITFAKTGTHYIIALGFGPESADNSCHAGLNGAFVDTADRIGSFGSDGEWEEGTLDGEPARFDIPAAGEYTVNFWMREDGFIFDKFVISTNPDFRPTKSGPRESLQGAAPDRPDPRGNLFFYNIRHTNTMTEADFVPKPAVAEYRVQTAATLPGPFVPDSNSVAYGFQLFAGATLDRQYFNLEIIPIDTDLELGMTALNRLAYGPTPDELERVLYGPSAIGADAFIAEQLAPEAMVETADGDSEIDAIYTLLEQNVAVRDDLGAWFALRAIRADRQLLEILTQFVNNHFVTYHEKTQRWFKDQGLIGDDDNFAAAHTEYWELKKWREILLDPDGTFEELLRISAMSPAMIIYLDTVLNDAAEPNENFAREIVELFTMGVDNGYTQDDIEEIARIWTGWRVGLVDPADVDDPFAPPFDTNTVLLAPQSSGWNYREGTSEPPTNWMMEGYAPDTNWFACQTSIGYGDNDDNTFLANMSNGLYTTVYLRHNIVLNDMAQLNNSRFQLYSDDGCIVYMNGTEIARFNASGPKTFDDTANGTVGDADWETAPLLVPLDSVMHVGTNVIAIHGLNRGTSSSDFSIDVSLAQQGAWSFTFDPAAHDTANKVIFPGQAVDARFGPPYAGQPYELALPARSGTNGVQDGFDLVTHLADLPYTREYIVVKLCQVFVHEDFAIGGYYNTANLTPEEQLVKDCIAAWGDGGGHIRNVLNTIFQSELFRSQYAARQKVKTPYEFTVSAIRALRGALGGGGYGASTDGYDLEEPMDLMGMKLFQRSDPDGWPEAGKEWLDTGTVAERLRFIQNLMMEDADPLKDVDYGAAENDNLSNPTGLIAARLAGPQQSDPDAVIDYLLSILFPGEGFGNLDLERVECIYLLDTDANETPSPFNVLTVGSPEYDRRVRALTGLLLANPRFQEQ